MVRVTSGPDEALETGFRVSYRVNRVWSVLKGQGKYKFEFVGCYTLSLPLPYGI